MEDDFIFAQENAAVMSSDETARKIKTKLRKPRSNDDNKLFLLSLIQENKDLLIGSFDIQNGITHEARTKKWQEIFNLVVAHGMTLGDHDWKHIRHVI